MPAICPITGKQTIDLTEEENYIQYSINFHDTDHTLRLSKIAGWDTLIKPQDKTVLRSMLFNKEWPIEEETIITPGLVSNICRLGEYPKSFDEKVDHYLLKHYKNGGSEYRNTYFRSEDHLDAYAADKEEFVRIVKALELKEYIRLLGTPSSDTKNTSIVELTEKGVTKGRELALKASSEDPRQFKDNGPGILVLADQSDKFYKDILTKYLLSFGCLTNDFGDLDTENGAPVVFNIRQSLLAKTFDYLIFIKSASSDRNNTFGTLLEIAIDTHNTIEIDKINFIYFAFTDDSNINSRPRIADYSRTIFDFRIKTNRKRLINSIEKDWEERKGKTNVTTSKYDLPLFPLDKNEKLWLETVYDKFIKEEDFDYEALFASMWRKFPNEFDRSQIDPVLITGNTNITLLGIWQIHPESDIFEKFDKVIRAIRDIIQNEVKKITENITSDEIVLKVPDLTPLDIRKAFKLMSPFGYFHTSIGFGPEQASHIGINRAEVLEEYRNYPGVENLIINYLKKYPPRTKVNINTEDPDDLFNKKIKPNNKDAHKANITLRDKNNIRPVFGVLELAKELSQIIRTFPVEKGQMIGIFGKWGRGKTFFINEIWNVLKTDDVGTKYHKLEYHAWKYQEAPASWAYLYEIFRNEFLGKINLKNWFSYSCRLLKLNIARLGYLPILLFSATIVIPIISSIALFEKDQLVALIAVPTWLAIFGIVLGNYRKEYSTKALELIKKYSSKHSFKDKIGIQADIQDELVKLLKVWIPEKKVGKVKILLIVEDIDRCSEEKVIQNIDALRVMLDEDEICKRLVIVTAIDERILKNAVRIKYTPLLKTLSGSVENEHSPNENKRSSDDFDLNVLIPEYLDKIFISAIKLGELNTDQREEYLKELLEKELDSSILKELKKKEEIETQNKVPGLGLTDMLHTKLSKAPKVYDIVDIENAFDKFFNKIKDGDVVVLDAKEKNTSTAETEQANQNRSNEYDQFKGLSLTEATQLTDLVRTWYGATPRKIRIYYYRYLLCKNLLINKYALIENGRSNIWQYKDGIRALMVKILEYTLLHSPDQISEEKRRILHEMGTNKSELIKVEKITVYKIDYYYLLEVLEMAIAY